MVQALSWELWSEGTCLCPVWQPPCHPSHPREKVMARDPCQGQSEWAQPPREAALTSPAGLIGSCQSLRVFGKTSLRFPEHSLGIYIKPAAPANSSPTDPSSSRKNQSHQTRGGRLTRAKCPQSRTLACNGGKKDAVAGSKLARPEFRTRQHPGSPCPPSSPPSLLGLPASVSSEFCLWQGEMKMAEVHLCINPKSLLMDSGT